MSDKDKEGVKIDSLELENVKRVRAVELRPGRDGLTVIGGRNGQGKSSVLDAIMWALGGERYRPDEPTRRGAATPARVRVEMSNGLVAERRGKTGALHVTDESGRKAGQQLLNEFVSQLALDLPRFMHGSDSDKATALLHTLGIDDQLAALDGQIRGTYEDRQLAGRDAKAKRAHADRLPRHTDAPDAPVSVADLVREQQGILARNGERQRKRDRAGQLRRAVEDDHREQDAARQAVEDATRRAAEARALRIWGSAHGASLETRQGEEALATSAANPRRACGTCRPPVRYESPSRTKSPTLQPIADAMAASVTIPGFSVLPVSMLRIWFSVTPLSIDTCRRVLPDPCRSSRSLMPFMPSITPNPFC